MIKGQADQTIGAQMVSAIDGSAFAGTVTVYITGDAGTQAIGSVSGGVCTLEGNGYYTYRPTEGETNYDLIAFTFIGSGAVPATIQVPTITAGQSASLSLATTTPNYTVADLLTATFRRINVIQENEPPSPEAMADGFRRLKAMLGLWRLQRLTIPFTQRTTWTIDSTKGTTANPYTVGTGGDIDVAKPPQANQLTWKFQDTSVTPSTEYPLANLTDRGYQLVVQKDLTSTLPTWVYYSATFASSLGSLYMGPIPDSSSLEGVLYAPASLQNFAATSTILIVPDGYELAIQENLAVLLWPEFREGVPMDRELRESARNSLHWLKTANVRMEDLAVSGFEVYDINADENTVYH